MKRQLILKEQGKQVITITKEMIEARLLILFKNHIGKSNEVTQEEVFQAVTGINSYAVNSFNRFYWRDMIEQSIRKLRRTGTCFIIKQKGRYFVLQAEVEANFYKEICDKSIKNLENAKIKADSWVENEKWKIYKDTPTPLQVDLMPIPEIDKSTTEEEKSILPPEASEPNRPNFKQRIIKLYKGEQ